MVFNGSLLLINPFDNIFYKYESLFKNLTRYGSIYEDLENDEDTSNCPKATPLIYGPTSVEYMLGKMEDGYVAVIRFPITLWEFHDPLK